MFFEFFIGGFIGVVLAVPIKAAFDYLFQKKAHCPIDLEVILEMIDSGEIKDVAKGKNFIFDFKDKENHDLRFAVLKNPGLASWEGDPTDSLNSLLYINGKSTVFNLSKKEIKMFIHKKVEIDNNLVNSALLDYRLKNAEEIIKNHSSNKKV